MEDHFNKKESKCTGPEGECAWQDLDQQGGLGGWSGVLRERMLGDEIRKWKENLFTQGLGSHSKDFRLYSEMGNPCMIMSRGGTRSDLHFRKEHFGSCMEKRPQEIRWEGDLQGRYYNNIVWCWWLRAGGKWWEVSSSRCTLEVKPVGIADGIHRRQEKKSESKDDSKVFILSSRKVKIIFFFPQERLKVKASTSIYVWVCMWVWACMLVRVCVCVCLLKLNLEWTSGHNNSEIFCETSK